MEKVSQKYDVGVVVGRFQVDELHEAHLDMLKTIVDLHPKVIVFLGVSARLGSPENPLDFEARKQMITEQFPGIIVLPIRDVRSNKDWVLELNFQIQTVVAPGQSVVLYGSRDSFISVYEAETNRYPTQELVQTVFVSGSDVRNRVSKQVQNTPEFRRGVIWSAYNRYPTCYATVDVAIFNEDYTKLLMARKPGEAHCRFVGGFSDPKSASLEDDARREVAEETTLEIGNMMYIGSARIDDWRYRGSRDCIKTSFFSAKLVFGRPTPSDDICELRWFEFSVGGIVQLRENIVPEHRPLLSMLWDASRLDVLVVQKNERRK